MAGLPGDRPQDAAERLRLLLRNAAPEIRRFFPSGESIVRSSRTTMSVWRGSFAIRSYTSPTLSAGPIVLRTPLNACVSCCATPPRKSGAFFRSTDPHRARGAVPFETAR
jgi:hypothetical protein